MPSSPLPELTIDRERTEKTTSFKRVLAGSMAGAVLEWYDFAIYGILAVTVLGPVFFPGDNDLAKLLLALATQGLGFVARPLGGIVFGHLGDKIGRQPMLVITFVLLGSATAAIGLLPSYATWGIAATFCLVILRMIQGFALGGEFGAAVLLVSEYGDPKRRGFWTAWPQAGAPAGTILATLVVTALALLLPAQDFESWGWRTAFLLSVPLLLVGWWIRRGVEESPVFREAQAKAARNAPTQKQESSIVAALKNPRPVLHGLGLRLGENVAFYVYTIFVVTYATNTLHFQRNDILLAVTAASLCQLCGMLLGGHWSDHVGRKKAMLVPAIILVIWAPLFFILAQQQSLPLLWLGIGVGAFFHGMLAGTEASWITELFPTRYRFAGASLVFQGSSIIAGAPAPLIAVWLVSSFGHEAVVWYLALTMLITIVAVATGPETKGKDIHD